MNKGNISTNDNNNINLENIFEELDVPFTEAELEKCLKALKKNKSVGTDTIMNEYILTGNTTLIPVLCKLFNNILMSGIFPESSYPFSRMVMLTIQGITEGFHYFPMSENFLPR
jgi:hypothetical protein